MVATKSSYVTSTHLEDYIYRLYTSIDIFHSRQLNPELIAGRLGLIVDYLPINSTNEGDTIILDSRLSDAQQWQDFGHELCHAILHVGNQINTPPLFREYKEWKANNFAYHVCVPTFMLDRIDLPTNERKAIWMIQESFHVELEFAEIRLNQYVNNCKQYYY